MSETAIFECRDGRYFAGWLWSVIEITDGPLADVLGAVYRDAGQATWTVRMRIRYCMTASTQWGDMMNDPKDVTEIIDSDSTDGETALQRATDTLQRAHEEAQGRGLLRIIEAARAIPCMTDDHDQITAVLMAQSFCHRPQARPEA